MIYIASEGVDLKGNVKSTGGSSVLPKAPLFSFKENGGVWLRGSGRVHLKTEDLKSDAYNLTFCLWGRTLDTDMKLKAMQRLQSWAPCNHGDARRTLNNSNKLRRFEAACIDFQLFVCVEDYVGFCKQLILFGFCVWENFRKSTQQRKRLWSMDAIRFLDFFDEKNDWDRTPRGLYFIRWAQF